MLKSLLIIFILLAHGITYARNLTDIRSGVTYMQQWRAFRETPTPYGYRIGKTVRIAGKDALEVWLIDVSTKKKKHIITYLYIDGTKVYQLGNRNTEYENKWLLFYDFGLQPGETMIGYSPFGTKYLKYIYRCVEIKEYPCCKGLKIMILETNLADNPIYWTQGIENTKWILNYGSSHGLLQPTMSHIIGGGVETLTGINKGRKKIYSVSDLDLFLLPEEEP